MSTAEVATRVRELEPDLVAIRRQIHQHPEVAFELERTTRIVADRLAAAGWEVETDVGGQGVVGILHGSRPGKVLAIRPDMDALPFPDWKQVPYASQVPDVMHACGHDAHTAIGIGIAEILAGMRDQISGTVKLLFDPAEETGGGSEALGGPPCGPKALRAAGVLENPKVDALMGFHNLPEIPVGQVWVRPGVIFTGYDMFSLEVTGKETHAARRHQGKDAILAASHVIQTLYGAGSRMAPSNQVFSLNVGLIEGGKDHNLIPSTATMRGTVRCGDLPTRADLGARLEALAKSAAESADCTADFTFTPGNPPVVNDPALTTLVHETAAGALGADNAVIMDAPLLIGDTFCFLAEGVPSVYWLFGSGNADRGITYPLHHSLYDLDEASIGHALQVAVEASLAYLNGG